MQSSHINYLPFFCIRDLYSFLHLFIYSIFNLHQYRPVDIYFIHGVIIQYYFAYCVTQIVPALQGFSFDFCAPLTYHHHCGSFLSVFSTYFLVPPYASGPSCIFPVPGLEWSFLQGVLASFIGEWY